MRQNKYEYDAFISHAVEDKIPIANDLCAKLEQAGLRVWYSGKELGIGDSIEKTIENGLHRSRYGIVILSPTYLAKNWTIREFYTLLAKEIEDRKVILPVLFNVTPDDLRDKDLHMADRFAVNADMGLDHVVARLVAEIRRAPAPKRRVRWLSGVWAVLTFSLMLNMMYLVRDISMPLEGYSSSSHPNVVPAGLASWSPSREAARVAGDCSGHTGCVSFVLHLDDASHVARLREILTDLSRKSDPPPGRSLVGKPRFGTYPVH